MIHEKQMGQQILVNMYQCQSPILNDIHEIQNIIHQLTILLDTYILKEDYHQFEPQGITAFAIISASHIAIHTWPEDCFLSLDIFTCKPIKPEKIIPYLTSYLASQEYTIKTFLR